MKDVIIRISTAMIGLILFFIVIFADQLVLNIALGVIVLAMLFELFNAFKFGFTLTCAGLIGSVILQIACQYSDYNILIFVIMLYVAAVAVLAVIGHNKLSIIDVFTMFFCTLYITFFTLFIGKIREISTTYGIYYMLLIFGSAWLSDTGAYFVGKFFGKRKLVPQISPKKTVEGSIGGVVVATIGCVIISIIAQFFSGASPKYLLIVPIAIIGSCLGQIGDLLASLIKRTCGVKDFGNIMPGHGGVLDRFDSVLLVSPFVYFLCIYCASISFPIF